MSPLRSEAPAEGSKRSSSRITDGDTAGRDAASRVLPDGLALARLLQECTLPQCENVFAQLARLLSALRHADAGAAAKAVEGYATILLALQEAR